jgi:hypothetical protein
LLGLGQQFLESGDGVVAHGVPRLSAKSFALLDERETILIHV